MLRLAVAVTLVAVCFAQTRPKIAETFMSKVSRDGLAWCLSCINYHSYVIIISVIFLPFSRRGISRFITIVGPFLATVSSLTGRISLIYRS